MPRMRRTTQVAIKILVFIAGATILILWVFTQKFSPADGISHSQRHYESQSVDFASKK